MRRGDVVWADLKPRSGSEQRGRRPAIIVSDDGFNEVETWRSVMVVPVSTSTRKAQRGPTAVALRTGDAGLHGDSIALCHQITTLDRRKILELMGSLSKESIAAVDEGLRTALDLTHPR